MKDDMAKVFKTLGASNHTDKERENNDYYATDPVAIDILLNEGDKTNSDSLGMCLWQR